MTKFIKIKAFSKLISFDTVKNLNYSSNLNRFFFKYVFMLRHKTSLYWRHPLYHIPQYRHLAKYLSTGHHGSFLF